LKYLFCSRSTGMTQNST